MNTNVEKLGDVQVIIYRLLKLTINIKNEDMFIKNFIDSTKVGDEIKNNSFISLENFVVNTEQITGDTFGEYITSIYNLYNTNKDKIFNKFIDELINSDSRRGKVNDLQTFKGRLNYMLKNDDNTLVDKLCNIGMKEFEKWYNLIVDNSNGDIVYRTYHSTKGLESDNLVIILKSRIGSRGLKLLEYLKSIGDLEIEDSNQARNLFYVTCSRAISNLAVLYADDNTPLDKETVENISRLFK